MLEPIIREDLLYYLWRMKSFDMVDLQTTDGRIIEIIDFGKQNHDSGPDFSNAKIRIGDTLWAGNVEMHVYSKDWIRHTHDLDKAYDNVILHVVFEHDQEIFTTREQYIPCLELKNRIPANIKSRYASLVASTTWIPCESQIQNVEKHTIRFWLHRLVAERVERKTKYIQNILTSTQYNWEETLYIALARYVGARVNMDPFESLAKSLPRSILLKNIDNLQSLEALLYGQSGMLEGTHSDMYYQELKKEYSFLKRKYELKSIPAISWKFARMRPAGFPTIRIAQLAQIIYRTEHLFSQILETKETKELRSLFTVSPSSYWESHYRFGKESVRKSKRLGNSMIDLILINVVSPILFLYGKESGNENYCDRAIYHLENCKAERNSITKQFDKLGVKSENAADTQALIQLKNEYCEYKKCISCSIGNKLIHLS